MDNDEAVAACLSQWSDRDSAKADDKTSDAAPNLHASAKVKSNVVAGLEHFKENEHPGARARAQRILDDELSDDEVEFVDRFFKSARGKDGSVEAMKERLLYGGESGRKWVAARARKIADARAAKDCPITVGQPVRMEGNSFAIARAILDSGRSIEVEFCDDQDGAYAPNGEAGVVGVDELTPLQELPPVDEAEDWHAHRPLERRGDRALIRVGGFCSWAAVDGMRRGKIEQLHKSGAVHCEGRDGSLTASEEDPVAGIRLYERKGNGWLPSEQVLIRHVSEITGLAGLNRPKDTRSHLRARAASSDTGEITIYADIGDGWFGGVTAADVDAELKKLGNIKYLDVRINSGGGSAFEGIAMYNRLRQHKAHVRVYIDGFAASAASLVAMAGDEIIMFDTSSMMIHAPFTMAEGNAAELREVAATLDKIATQMAGAYAERSGLSVDDMTRIMKKDTWFTANEALEHGFADRVEEGTRMAAASSRPWFKSEPPSGQRLAAAKARLKRQEQQLASLDPSRGETRAERAQA